MSLKDIVRRIWFELEAKLMQSDTASAAVRH